MGLLHILPILPFLHSLYKYANFTFIAHWHNVHICHIEKEISMKRNIQKEISKRNIQERSNYL